MVFKIGSIKNLAIFTGKHLCWDHFLIELHVLKVRKFLKIDSNTGVSCGYSKILFSNTTPLVAASDCDDPSGVLIPSTNRYSQLYRVEPSYTE